MIPVVVAKMGMTSTVRSWLEGTSFELVSTSLRPGGVLIVVNGEGEPPATDRLVDAMRDRMQSEATVDLEIMPVQRQTINLGSAEQSEP